MKRFLYKGKLYNLRQLSEVSGIKYSTLAERIKRGYTVEEAVSWDLRVPTSVLEFDSGADYRDWHGVRMSDLYQSYWQWCLTNGHRPESNAHFSRNIRRLHPNIRVVPTRVKSYGGVEYVKIVRVDSY